MIIWGGWIFFFIGHLFVTSFSLPGLIGLRYYLIMLPILVLLPLAIRDLDHLNSLLLKYYYLAIPVGILGVVQFMSPASSRINTYAWSSAEMAVATLGEKSCPHHRDVFLYFPLCSLSPIDAAGGALSVPESKEAPENAW